MKEKVKAFFRPKDKDIRERNKYTVEVLCAIISAVSLVFVVKTFVEMRIQRQSSYKPIIAIANSEITIDKFKVVESVNDESESLFSVYDFSKRISEIGSYYLELENIGFGTARNIEVVWDKDNFSNYCYFFKRNEVNSETVDLTFEEDGDLKIIKNGDLNGPILEEKISQDTYNPFLKNIDTEDSFKVDATFFTHLMFLSYFTSYEEEIPKILLNISYEDIYSKKYNTQVFLNYEIEEQKPRKSNYKNLVLKILPELKYSD